VFAEVLQLADKARAVGRKVAARLAKANPTPEAAAVAKSLGRPSPTPEDRAALAEAKAEVLQLRRRVRRAARGW
jgi:hypothetical protein